MTLERNKRTQQPSPKHDPTMQSSSSSLAPSSLTYPPGFRFVPTDEELITYYLKTFSRDKNKKSWTNDPPIHQANIYESNPQQLSVGYKKGNLTEWFFISERTKIKRNGTNQKRVDHNGGYWHGKAVSKKIKVKKDVIGYKTTLNYYVGKQPNGEKSNWLMQEYWLKSSDHNNTVDHALCKIYLRPTAKRNKNEEDDEDSEEEVENQQRDGEYQEPLQAQPLNTIHHHQPEHHDMAYQEPHQPHALDTFDNYQPQRQDIEYQEPHQPHALDSIDYHQPHRHDIAYQEPNQFQPQPLVTTHHHQQQRHHDIEYQELHQPQPQLPQFGPAPLDSHPPHCHDIQYPQPQPLNAIEYQYLYQSGPLVKYENVIESSTQENSNGDSKKVDHALKVHLTPRGVKRNAEEEMNEKRKKKKEEEGVEEELEQSINSHQIKDDDDSFFTGFVDSHQLDIDIEAINSSCLNKSSDKD